MKKIIATLMAPAAIGPYSQAVRRGDLLFVSGQLPLDPDSGRIPEGIVEQSRQALRNLQAVLEAGGSSIDAVVKTTVFLADMNDFEEMNRVYATFFSADPPARSTVEVARLPKDVRVEIDCIAG